MIEAEILYETHCPHTIKTCENLCKVITKHNLDVNITIRNVKESDHLYFGSPTLLIEKKDVGQCYQPKIIQEKSNNTCRIYTCDEHIGCPSIDMIECAFLSLNLIE